MHEPESLGSIIARGKVPGPKRKRQRLDLLAVNWEHVAGPRLAEHSAPTKLTRGTLTVAADSPAWAAELTMETQALLVRTKAIMGDEGVKKVRVQSRPSASESGKDVRTQSDVSATDDTDEVGGMIGEELGEVEDAEMRTALTRLVRASKAGKQSEQG